MKGSFATRQTQNCPRSSSVGKALEVLVGSERDVGQQQIPATTMANSGLGCTNKDRKRDQGQSLFLIIQHSLDHIWLLHPVWRSPLWKKDIDKRMSSGEGPRVLGSLGLLSLEQQQLWGHLTAAPSAYGELLEGMEISTAVQAQRIRNKKKLKQQSFSLAIRRDFFPMRTVR